MKNPVLDSSALVSGMISELVVGAITGVTSVRRFFFRIILFVAITVAAVSFTIGMLFRDYVPNKAATAGQIAAPAPESAKPPKNQPPPRERDDPEEIQQLIRKDPL